MASPPSPGTRSDRNVKLDKTPSPGYGDEDVGLRRHRHRGRPQRPHRGGGHGPGRDAGPLPREEPLHRRDGDDHRAGPRLPVRTGRVDPVPDPERDLRRPRLRPCPIYEPEVQSASIGAVGSAADPPLQRPRTPARAPQRRLGLDAVHGHGRGRGLGRGAGTGHRPVRGAAAAPVTRRDVGLRRRTRRSARPSGPPCSAA